MRKTGSGRGQVRGRKPVKILAVAAALTILVGAAPALVADTVTLYPTSNAVTGTVRQPTSAYDDNSVGALVNSKTATLTLSGFDNTDLGTKTGRASAQSALWMVAWGNAGTKAAAENGGIKVIKHADSEVLSVLFGLYSKSTTIVYGD